MRAVVYDRYGPPEVLQIAEVERPEPGEDEVLVRIHASTVNRTDAGLRSAEYVASRFFTGLLRPKRGVAGMEFAGEVEAVGSTVTEFAVGDRVFGVRTGANADYLCVREAGAIATIPDGISYEVAAAVGDGGTLALAFLRRANLAAGQRILVYGASGSIGTAAVQLARHLGAHVTAVCNTKNLEVVRSLGADEVLDYTRDDFTRNGQVYDVLFDAVGKLSFRRCRRSLKPGGVFTASDPGFLWQNALLALWTKRFGARKVVFPIPKYTKQDVRFLGELLAAGEYRPVIDRSYPLEDVVEATRYVETEQKTGNVVLTVNGGRPR